MLYIYNQNKINENCFEFLAFLNLAQNTEKLLTVQLYLNRNLFLHFVSQAKNSKLKRREISSAIYLSN